ncbi:ferrous iron transport protein A [Nocardia sp. ET3-3]|uniref:Ferrous iron transport protein A n=1 Tax=Nocardia terrae TaxID=2675851 RepID=A0A7K1V3U7_9NOCA|nr:FeoA domain-containing protein [Nocardia terrae]MVU81197.1 ferrous iron transport protein A [Nocardia terrae]
MSSLIDSEPGEKFRIGRIRLLGRQRRRLLEMGLIPGAPVSVATVGVGGGRILCLGESRIAVDAATARTIEVARETAHE